MGAVPRTLVNNILMHHDVERTLAAIREAATTGKIGDGLIFIYPVEEDIRIRTGEQGREALAYPNDIDEQKANSD